MQFPHSDFWDFSVTFYQLSEVEQCCLKLQDEHDLNVNLVLFCCWLAIQKQQLLNPELCRSLLEISEKWQEIIKPLLLARQHIKDTPVALAGNLKKEARNNIGQIELNMEHMHQLSLEQNLIDRKIETSHESIEIITNHNLMLYLSNTDHHMTEKLIKRNFEPLLNATQEYLKRRNTVN